jgi:hypothetical protein
MIPSDELEALLQREEAVVFDPESRMLLLIGRDGATPFPVSVVPPDREEGRRLPEVLREKAAAWMGTDGRPARVVWFGAGPGPRPELALAR